MLPSMSHRVRIALAIFLVGLLGVAAWRFLWPSEPAYAGRSLSQWLDQAFWTGGPTAETTRAIQSMRTNAIPGLLRLVDRKDTAFRRAVVMFFRRSPRVLFRVHSADDYHWMATWGFSALGPTPLRNSSGNTVRQKCDTDGTRQLLPCTMRQNGTLHWGCGTRLSSRWLPLRRCSQS